MVFRGDVYNDILFIIKKMMLLLKFFKKIKFFNIDGLDFLVF